MCWRLRWKIRMICYCGFQADSSWLADVNAFLRVIITEGADSGNVVVVINQDIQTASSKSINDRLMNMAKEFRAGDKEWNRPLAVIRVGSREWEYRSPTKIHSRLSFTIYVNDLRLLKPQFALITKLGMRRQWITGRGAVIKSKLFAAGIQSGWLMLGAWIEKSLLTWKRSVWVG